MTLEELAELERTGQIRRGPSGLWALGQEDARTQEAWGDFRKGQAHNLKASEAYMTGWDMLSSLSGQTLHKAIYGKGGKPTQTKMGMGPKTLKEYEQYGPKVELLSRQPLKTRQDGKLFGSFVVSLDGALEQTLKVFYDPETKKLEIPGLFPTKYKEREIQDKLWDELGRKPSHSEIQDYFKNKYSPAFTQKVGIELLRRFPEAVSFEAERITGTRRDAKTLKDSRTEISTAPLKRMMGRLGLDTAVEDKALGPTFDPVKGIGAVPNNEEISYRGFVKMMSPQEFQRLAPNLTGGLKGGSLEYLVDALHKGKPFGNPFLKVKWNEDLEGWEVKGHEGRHRMEAIRKVFDDDFSRDTADPIKIPVHMFVEGGSSSLTPEKKNSRRFNPEGFEVHKFNPRYNSIELFE